MFTNMERLLTVGLPALSVAVLIFAVAVEVAFLASPAASYCGVHEGFLQVCVIPSQAVAGVVIGLSITFAAAAAASCALAWRGRLGLAAFVALPGMVGPAIALFAALGSQGSQNTTPLISAPPAGYDLYKEGAAAALAGGVLLAAACCVQFAFRQRRPR
jgi:hypothetical protein